MYPILPPTGAGDDWKSDPSRMRMMESISNPLVIPGNRAIFYKEGGDKDEHKRPSQRSTNTVKIQKKGAAAFDMVPLESVRTWDHLQAKLRTLHNTTETPTVVAYSGDLIQDASSYDHALQQQSECLHLIISYPSDLSALAVAFSSLLGRPSTLGDDADLAAGYAPSARSRREGVSSGFCAFHLLPPKLLFFTQWEIRCHVTMENASLTDVCNFSRWRRSIDDKEQEEGTGMPPWSPYVYAKPGAVAYREEDWNGDDRGEYGSPIPVAAGRTFPMSTWEVWSQNRRAQVLSSVSAEFTASPSGCVHTPAVLTDEVSLRPTTSHQWAVYPDPDGDPAEEREVMRSSQIRVYANYDKTSDPDIDHRERQGWWMANAKMIPAEFAGREGARSFLCSGLPQLEVFLEGFLSACGLHGAERKEFITHWLSNLSPPGSKEWEHLILLKFLTPRELRALLPLKINPVPDRLIRIFAVFRVATRQQLLREGIVARGVFMKEVEMVLDGSAPKDGLTVIELGGASVLDAPAVGSRETAPAPDMDASSERTPTAVTPGLVLGEAGMVEWKA